MPAPASKIWIPDSHYDKQIMVLNGRLRNYDPRLQFGRNEDNGDWCVFLTVSRGEMVPVLGFQNTVPTPDELMQRVHAADTRRHGDEVLRMIQEHNEKIRAEQEYKASEASGELAEGMESFLHAQGKTPYSRSYSRAIESKRTGG